MPVFFLDFFLEGEKGGFLTPVNLASFSEKSNSILPPPPPPNFLTPKIDGIFPYREFSERIISSEGIPATNVAPISKPFNGITI